MTASTPDTDDRRIVRLDDVGMPRLLFSLLRGRFTGAIEITQPSPHDGTRTVWLRGGMPVFTDWVAPTDVLGQVLIDLRQIDRAELDSALQAMVSGGHLLGQVLRDLELLDERQITEGLRTQCERKLIHAFGLREGEVILRPEEELQHLPGLGQVNVLALVMRGVSKHFDEDEIARAMGDVMRGPLATGPAFDRYAEQFRFRAADATAVEALTRGTTLDELRDLQKMSRRRAAQLVFALWNCDMLEVGERAAERRRDNESKAASRTPRDRPAAPRASSRPTARPSPVPTARLERPAKKPAAEASGARLEIFEVELHEFEDRLQRGAHAFELLGLPPRVGERDIARTFATISRRLDGGRVSSRRPDLAERAERVLEALDRANELLCNTEQRRALEQLVAEDGTRPGLDAVARARMESRSAERQADKLLKAGKVPDALDTYREAAALGAEKPEVEAAIAWCEYLTSKKKPEDAKRAGRALNRIIGRNSDCARAHYYRGMLLLALDNRAGALRSFNAACEVDPRYTDAQRQVQILSSEGSPSRGRFGTLFRRK
jgi:tetratricopeptide (TPR) repeat protein